MTRFRSDSLHSPSFTRVGIAVLFACALLSAPASGQVGWFVQPNPATTNLYHVDFLDSQIGWVSGEEGAILQTTDGGADWKAQNSGTIYGMRGISFGSALVGVAVGAGGTILRTSDGGATWITVRTDYVDSFFNVEMLDDHFGCAVGTNGIHRAWAAVTGNGGATWFYRDFLINNTQASLTDVHFFDNLNGLVSAYVQGGTGAIYRSSNGGVSWVQVMTTPYGLYSLSFPTPQIGFACGLNGYLLQTTDGGATWTPGSTGSGVTGYGVSFPETGEGWVVGSVGSIRHTQDGGGSWEQQTSGTNLTLNSIQMVDRFNGVIAGDNGLILRTVTGGGSGAAVDGPGPLLSAAPRLLASLPNPFGSSTLVRFDAPSAGPIRLEIFDCLGRQIRSVQLDQTGRGAGSWTWDGADDGGRQVAPGAYQCRIRDASGNASYRVIVRVRD